MDSSLPCNEATTNQKLRGGYYTPSVIAQFLAGWAIQEATDTVLEPSCGDGMLLEAAIQRLQHLGASPHNLPTQVQGIELYPSEACQTQKRLESLGVSGQETIFTGDFFEYDDQDWGIIGRRFDVVIGNPPFLRYHSFPDEQRNRAFRVMRTAGLNPTKLTNSWVPFLVAASLRLTSKGRLAMVIPAELLQVKYAEETRAFLAKQFGAITIITFRRLVFEGIQQEVVLLLAEKSPEIESGIDVIEMEDAEELRGYEVVLRERRHLKALDHAQEKWTQYYLAEDEIALLRQTQNHPQLLRLRQVGCVDVGIVTGNNNFFVLNQEQIQTWGLEAHTLPLIGRTAQLPGLVLTDTEWNAHHDTNGLCHLLNLPAVPHEKLPTSVQAYIHYGESQAVHTGFKCSHRTPWYTVPSLWSPDAFLFRQIHQYPKMVLNATPSVSTDTIHRVRYHQSENGPQITASFLNVLTFAFSEVMGRSYGGGVLELEPNEAELLPIPFFPDLSLDFAELDRLERAGEIATILAITDTELLQKRLHLDKQDIARFHSIWRKLSGRRLGRKASVLAK